MKLSNRKILITGANGLVGSALRDELKKRGNSVVSLVRSPTSTAEIKFQLSQPIDSSVFQNADVLIHCAHDFNAFTWNEIHTRNVEGSIQLIRTAVAAGVKRVVFISSISAFPGCRSLYGRGKLAVEEEVLRLGGIVIRSGLIYGDNTQGMFGSLARMTKRLPVLPVFGSGNQPFYLVHIADLVNAIANVCDSKFPSSRLLLVAHPKAVPFNELLKAIARRQGRNIFLFRVPGLLMLLSLQCLERFGIRLGFSSDSLLSLLYYNPTPDFCSVEDIGTNLRTF